jgi:hypothetical protein
MSGGYYVYEADQRQKYGACMEFESERLQNIPVRCYDELKINKGCFHVESHMVGKTRIYSVIPLCE